jgi:hypothetical protein
MADHGEMESAIQAHVVINVQHAGSIGHLSTSLLWTGAVIISRTAKCSAACKR